MNHARGGHASAGGALIENTSTGNDGAPETDEPTDDRPRRGWVSALALTALTAMAIEIVSSLVGQLPLDGRGNGAAPFVGTSLWEIAALVVVLRYMRRLGLPVGGPMTAVLCGGVAVWLAGFARPAALHFVEPSYYGINHRMSLKQDEDGDGNIRPVYPLERDVLHTAECRFRLVDKADLARENEAVGEMGFLTWQKGMARGYSLDPRCVSLPPTVSWKPSAWERIVLFATVGPVTLVEHAVWALHDSVPVLLVFQLLLFAVRRRHVWWDEGLW